MSQDRSIFHGVAFFALHETEQKRVRDFVEAQDLNGLKELNTLEIFRHQTDLAVSLAYFEQEMARLKKLEKAGYFQHVSNDERQFLEEKMMLAYYVFASRLKLDWVEKRGRAISDDRDRVSDCVELLNQLRNAYPPSSVDEAGKQQLATISDGADNPVKYHAMRTIVPLVLDVFKEISDGKVQTTLEIMRIFNERRLYWVWAGGGGLLGTIVSLFSDDFYYKLQAQKALEWPQPYTGALSWVLYYIRFGIRAMLFARHVVPNPWMSDEEYNIPWRERFNTQWQQRKFYLLNDFFWAFANLVCAVLWFGSGMPGYLGGVLTGLLLLMDVSLAIWGYEEEKSQYIKDMLRYNNDIAALKEQLNESNVNKPSLQRKIDELERFRRMYQLDWDYKLYGLYNDLLYAVSLFCAFSLVCSFFFPPAALVPATALLCCIAGTVLCFAFNVLYDAIKQGLNVSKAIAAQDINQQDQKSVLIRYLRASNDNERKQCYLDYQLLQAENEQHEEEILYQKMMLYHSTLVNVLVPPVTFVALMFLPLGIGLPVLAAAFAVAVCSYYYIEANYKPKDVSVAAFDENAFQAFDADEELRKLQSVEPSQGFFSVISERLRVSPEDAVSLIKAQDF